MNKIITGLPRSRTKWFSQVFSFEHELPNGKKTLQEYRQSLKNVKGDSNTAFCLLAPHFWYEGKLVIINQTSERIEKINHWCCDNFGFSCLEYLIDCEALNRKLNGLHVKHSDIDTRLDEIADYLECDIVGDKHLHVECESYDFLDYDSASGLLNDVQKSFAGL